MALDTCVIPALTRFAELEDLLKLLNMYSLKEGYSIESTLSLAAGALPQIPLGQLTALPQTPPVVMGWRYEICEFTELLRLPAVSQTLLGNNIYNFVCNYQKFSILESSKSF